MFSNLYSFKPLFLALMAMAIFVLPSQASAQMQTKVAVVNIQKIMSQSKAAESIQDQLQKHRKSFQDEFSKHERDLMDQEKALVEARAEMTPEDFTKKKQEFESQLLETRKLVQKRQRALEEGAGKALGELRDQVVRIVAEMADEQEYDLVVTKQNVILAQKDMDITDEVMKRLNKNLKKVELKIDVN